MKLSDFDFYLPDELIAQLPTKERGDSRLMHVNNEGEIQHLQFSQITQLFRPGDLLVRNNVRVMKARLFGKKASGGKLEFLIERLLDHERVLSQIKASKSPKPGDTVFINGCECLVLHKENGFYELALNIKGSDFSSIEELIESAGHIPLPPYIRRDDNDFDAERYQTVFAKEPGAVAAPTAGLHFEEALFAQLEEIGVEVSETTLFVGSGTFQPVRVDEIEKHTMHKEKYVASEALISALQSCKNRGGRVIALGTTSLRVLETIAQDKALRAQEGETDIFIYPGYQFSIVDALITNFHLPKSSLLMLVSAFSGRERILKAYQSAVEQKYRFFSYGDAMFLEKAHIGEQVK